MISAGQLRNLMHVQAGTKDALGKVTSWARTGKTVRIQMDPETSVEQLVDGGTGTVVQVIAAGRWNDLNEAGVSESSRLEHDETGAVYAVKGVRDVGYRSRRGELVLVEVSR